MKLLRILTLVLASTLFVAATPPAEEPQGIAFFEGTWEEALAAAEAENKMIFLDAYASWCGPCKLLKRNVFPNEAVGSFYNENFINVKMDMEKGIGPKLSMKYGVTAYPTLLYINGDGSVVKKAIGYHQPNQLIDLGKQVLNKG